MGGMLALGCEGGLVKLVDEKTGEVQWAVQAHSLTSRWTEVAISPENGRFVASVNGVSGAVHRVGGATHDGSGAFRTQDCHRGRRRRGDRVGLSDTLELLRKIPADHTCRVITHSELFTL